MRPAGRSGSPRRSSVPQPISDPALLAAIHAALGGGAIARAALGGGAAVALAEAGLAPSRSEARRLVTGGAVTINGERISDPAARVPPPVAGEWYEIRIGKRRREIRRLEG